MKKIVSALLCLCLMAGCVLALIPTASAEVTNPERFPEMDKAELIYSEDFESADVAGATYADALIDALGWTGTAFADMAVQKDSDSSNHQLYFRSNANSSMTICTDDRLAGGNYVIEYTATMLTFDSSADGAGMGFRSSYTEEEAGWNFLAKERGNFDFQFHTATLTAANRHEEVDIAPEATTINGTERPNGSIVGQTIRFRLVIDAENGLSAYTVNQTTGEATIVVGMKAENVASWASSSATLNNTVMMRAIKTKTTYLVDDIQIWSNVKTESVPTMIGYQTTSLLNNTYDIRFLAGVKGIAATAMGFTVAYTIDLNGTVKSGSKKIYCEYLYETLSTDFGSSTVSAHSEGYNYLIALSITDIPSDASITYTVTPFAVFSSGTKTGTAEEYSVNREVLELVPVLSGGTLESTKEFTTDHHRLYYTGTTKAEYNAYVNSLPTYGFELYDENTIGNNIYKTFRSDLMILHAYYLAKTQTTTILVTETENWTAYPTAPTMDDQAVLPKLMMMDMSYLTQSNQNFGMCFVYTLEDGSYVIIDGGFATESEVLYKYLKNNNKRDDGKIVIRAWIITHPDGDHYNCFLDFTTNHVNDVKLEYFVAQFDQLHVSTSHTSVINKIYNSAAKYSGCKNIVPMAGQIMYFGTLKVEFFYTAEMYQGYTGVDLDSTQTNQSSLAFMAYLGDTTVFFSGDITNKAIDAVTDYYGSNLKCQYLQAPHHGLNGTTAFYDATLPEYLFMTTQTTAAALRLDSTHAHGKQSMLYYLVNKTGMPSANIYIAGELDDVAGDEMTIISLFTPPTLQNGNFTTQKDTHTFEELFGSN